MRLNDELDYETIYNGRGMEIGKMLVDYLDEKMVLVNKERLLPDRPDRNTEVGIRLTFRLVDEIEIICFVNRFAGFGIRNIGKNKESIREKDYISFDKLDELDFSLSDEVINEKLSMLKYALDAVRNGDEIIKFDVEK